MDQNAVNSTLQSLAFGEAMKAAAEDYKKELKAAEKAGRSVQHTQIDMGAFADDPELKKLHAERLEELKEAQEKRKDVSELRNQGHGQLKEIEESEFLPITTQTPSVVCHFFHPEFQRCVILDRHLEILAQKYVQTRFVKLNATKAPFFAEKLKIRILPCLVYFINGVATGRIVGFEAFEARDNFTTEDLETKLIEAEAIQSIQKPNTTPASRIRRGLMYGKLDSEDESSDFDDP